MFRMINLDATHADALLKEFDAKTTLDDHYTIDLLCCQSLVHGADGRAPASTLLAGRLGLTRSCFATARCHSEQEGVARGLALLTASGIWVLNSGSFAIGTRQETTTVQFALIRKRNASVLVLNVHLASVALIRNMQLAALFTHPLLREPYGAVALCADRAAALHAKEWQVLTAPSRYATHHVQEDAPGGMLCLLHARFAPIARVSVAACPSDLPGITLEFDVEPLRATKSNRPAFPLSFREQWLGYREHRSFA